MLFNVTFIINVYRRRLIHNWSTQQSVFTFPFTRSTAATIQWSSSSLLSSRSSDYNGCVWVSMSTHGVYSLHNNNNVYRLTRLCLMLRSWTNPQKEMLTLFGHFHIVTYHVLKLQQHTKHVRSVSFVHPLGFESCKQLHNTMRKEHGRNSL